VKPAEDAWEFNYWVCKTLLALPLIMKGLASLMLESYFAMVWGMLALGGAIYVTEEGVLPPPQRLLMSLGRCGDCCLFARPTISEKSSASSSPSECCSTFFDDFRILPADFDVYSSL
jgi:hypothetical protein